MGSSSSGKTTRKSPPSSGNTTRKSPPSSGNTTRKSPSSTKRKKTAALIVSSFVRNATAKRNIDVRRDLVKYVVDQELKPTSSMRIERFCKKQPPQTVVLYRGHKREGDILGSRWYSATKSRKVAKEEFAGETCCLFKIHAVDVPMIDVNKHVGDKIGSYAEEQEFIFLGGGTFYKDKSFSEPGFADLGGNAGAFECWYSLDSPVERALSQIPPDEYEFIESPADIFVSGMVLSDSDRGKVFAEILLRR